MRICENYNTSGCTFDLKCLNQHIDLRQIIELELQSALRGNQWALSCFGPIGGMSNLPNFIEDQSFEEIRLLFYETKTQDIPSLLMQIKFNHLLQQANLQTFKLLNLKISNEEILKIIRMFNNPLDTATVPIKPTSTNVLQRTHLQSRISRFGVKVGDVKTTNPNPFALPQLDKMSHNQTIKIVGASQTQTVTPTVFCLSGDARYDQRTSVTSTSTSTTDSLLRIDNSSSFRQNFTTYFNKTADKRISDKEIEIIENIVKENFNLMKEDLLNKMEDVKKELKREVKSELEMYKREFEKRINESGEEIIQLRKEILEIKENETRKGNNRIDTTCDTKEKIVATEEVAEHKVADVDKELSDITTTTMVITDDLIKF